MGKLVSIQNLKNLYVWVRKNFKPRFKTIQQEISFQLSYEYQCSLTTKQLEYYSNEIFMMSTENIVHLVQTIQKVLRPYNSKQALVLLHHIIKKSKYKDNQSIYEHMIKYDLNLFFHKQKYKSLKEKSFFEFINAYWKYLLSLTFWANFYKEEQIQNMAEQSFDNYENIQSPVLDMRHLTKNLSAEFNIVENKKSSQDQVFEQVEFVIQVLYELSNVTFLLVKKIVNRFCVNV